MRWTKNWKKKMKGGVTVGAAAVAILIGVSVANTGGEDSAADPPVATQTTPSPAPDRPAAERDTPAPAPERPAVEIDVEETVSQQQARQSAESYLELGTGFSRSVLIDQLKFEGFSAADVTHAGGSCGRSSHAQLGAAVGKATLPAVVGYLVSELESAPPTSMLVISSTTSGGATVPWKPAWVKPSMDVVMGEALHGPVRHVDGRIRA